LNKPLEQPPLKKPKTENFSERDDQTNVPDVPLKPSRPIPPPEEEPPAPPPEEEEEANIPLLEDTVFAETLEPTEDIVNADYEEDPPLKVLDERTFTPSVSHSQMVSSGSQAPIGSPIPWNGSPLPWRGKTPSQLCKMFYPDGTSNLIGIHALYDRLRPFEDENAPTVTEIDNWNLEVLRYFRRLIGNTAPFTYDQRLFLQARWADERKYSKKWDSSYPATKSGAGPCPVGSGAHCGWLFVPNCIDQQPYLEEYPELECITSPLYDGGHGEGISSVKNEVPWANKLADALKLFLCLDGHEKHMGPIFGKEFGGTGVTYKSGRTRVGISFWDKGNGRSSVRFKWGGKV